MNHLHVNFIAGKPINDTIEIKSWVFKVFLVFLVFNKTKVINYT